MIDILLAFLKPAIGFFTGNPGRLKWFVIAIGVLSFGGTVWYLTDTYSDMKLEVVRLESDLATTENTNKLLVAELAKSQTQFVEYKDRYKKSTANRKRIENDFMILEKEHDEAQTVFDKECGRFQRLLDKRGSLVVRAANRATERMRVKIEKTSTFDF